MDLENWSIFLAGSFATMLFFIVGGMSGNASERVNGRRVFDWLCVLAAYIVGLYFIGLRPINGGSDTPKYVTTFMALRDVATAHAIGIQYFGNTEVLFWPLQALWRPFINSGSLWLVLVYTLTFGLSGIAYSRMSKESGAPAVIFVMLLFSYEAVYFGNIIRQVMSYPIGIVGVYYFHRRSYTLAALLVVLAIGLHWSSIIFLLLPGIWALRINSKSRAIIFFVACVALSHLILLLAQRMGALGGLMSISDKAAYYSQGVTNFGEIYHTFNFALSVLLILIFVISFDLVVEWPVVSACFLLFSGMVLVGVSVPTLSERFITNQLFFAPLMSWAFLQRFVPRAGILKRVILASVFIAMGVLVFSQESSTYTLGLTNHAK
ncbi:EpsG family protein [Rhodanobacter geophilus]|uniref:EpsG family protein n=1 Tax=Rhodanobacter geophilus TaxID=3162488 RepID=A0ABV3QRQ5_9GAMM